MNFEYIKRALCFHGQPMQKIWENERGAGDLQNLGLPIQPNYEIYQARQRYFTFQDRAKRLKLHQFFARKANDLYDSELKKYANLVDEKHVEKVKPYFATLPPYELFAHKPHDKVPRRWQAILEGISPGDIMYGIVVKTVPQGPLSVKPLCTAEPIIRYLNHLPTKALILAHEIGPLPLEKDGSTRGYYVNDFICCEVMRILVDVDRIFLGMTGTPRNPKIKFGLISRDDLPLYYTKANAAASQTYEVCLEQSKEFLNPNYDVLFSINGLDINDNFTFMGALKRPFPDEELAINLRKSQANKWAFRAVAEGIDRFKRGMHMEAFQCLNKALSIDPSNVEGLVARGALFANRGSFQKAVDDFRTALEVNNNHGNARKYMGETLVALGRSLEDEKRFEEAGKAYMDCLEIIPHHSQALECLEKLNQRTSGSGGIGILDSELLEHLMNLAAPSTSAAANSNQLLKKSEIPVKSSSEDSSSDSDDSNTDSETTNVPTQFSNIPEKTTKFQKEPSLSPLSKRMALHSASLQAAAAPKPLNPSAIEYDQPFYYNLTQPSAVTVAAAAPINSNDFKLEDDDTATRVRKLLEEASQHKKAKKNKKQKKNKKSKKTTKKEKTNMTDLSGSLFQNNYLQEAFKTVGSNNIKQKLDHDISSYEQKIADIKNRQAKLRNSLVGPLAAFQQKLEVEKSVTNVDDSPPPPPPPFMQISRSIPFGTKVDLTHPDANSSKHFFSVSTKPRNYGRQSTSLSSNIAESQKLSFQIRKPVKTDKLGMIRIATPLAPRSRSRTPYRQERRSSRDHSRSRHRYSHSRSRSKSLGRNKRRGRSRTRSRSHRSRSRSHSRRRYRSRSRSKSYSRRRSYSRSRSREGRRKNRRGPSPKTKTQTKGFGNRVWKRPGYRPSGSSLNDIGNGRWQHDKFDMINNPPSDKPSNDDDGPTIEEIDEIINQAQKDRKAEIIKRDKDILKKPFKGRF